MFPTSKTTLVAIEKRKAPRSAVEQAAKRSAAKLIDDLARQLRNVMTVPQLKKALKAFDEDFVYACRTLGRNAEKEYNRILETCFYKHASLRGVN